MTYLINFELGDWSRDGHNISEKYTVKSNKPVTDVREAHFACCSKLGFDPGEMCCEYEQFTLTESQFEQLLELKVIDAADKEVYDVEFGPEDLLNIWLKLLMLADPELQLVYDPEAVADLHFYGSDSRGRHLHTPGYGLFMP